jgi:hypothetical protein
MCCALSCCADIYITHSGDTFDHAVLKALSPATRNLLARRQHPQQVGTSTSVCTCVTITHASAYVSATRVACVIITCIQHTNGPTRVQCGPARPAATSSSGSSSSSSSSSSSQNLKVRHRLYLLCFCRWQTSGSTHCSPPRSRHSCSASLTGRTSARPSLCATIGLTAGEGPEKCLQTAQVAHAP